MMAEESEKTSLTAAELADRARQARMVVIRDRLDGINLVNVPLPPDLFDVEGASVDRVKRVSVQRAEDIRIMSRLDNPLFFEELAAIYPQWSAVVDCDYLDPIDGQPLDDPTLFKKLDVAQLNWLITHGLAYRPN